MFILISDTKICIINYLFYSSLSCISSNYRTYSAN
nr:MAG TPA: hypothetical protein [Bacteriophage sp.]